MSKEHTNKQSEEKHGEDTKKTKDDGEDEADEEHYFSNYYMALGALACILPGGFIIAWLIHSWN